MHNFLKFALFFIIFINLVVLFKIFKNMDMVMPCTITDSCDTVHNEQAWKQHCLSIIA